MNIGPNIQRFRREKGLTLVALARRLDTHPSNVKRWESSRVSPRWETVVRIAEALEVPVEDLAAGEDTRRPGRSAPSIPSLSNVFRDSEPEYLAAAMMPEEEEPHEDSRPLPSLEAHTSRMADDHEERAREYRSLSRFLRHPRFRSLREAIARLPEDLSAAEVMLLAKALEDAIRRREGGRDV